MAATRAARRSFSARPPETPALRRMMETTRATLAATATRAAATSRTGTGPTSWPATTAPAAITA